jgi:hypothetical protein
METKLCPGPHLKELLKSTKSAGHRDESVRQLGHHFLPLVHARNHVQLGQRIMSNLLLHERTRNDANDLAASSKHGVGESTHESHLRAAIHEHAVGFSNDLPERFRAGHEEWVGTRT